MRFLAHRLSSPVRICLIAVAVAAALAFAYSLRPPSALDFRLHRTRYEGIVRKVTQAGPMPMRFEVYRVSRNLDPESLRIDGPGVGGVEVIAGWDDAGRCRITIRTTDEGHLGYMGYIYSDGVPLPERYDTWPMCKNWWAFHDNNW